MGASAERAGIIATVIGVGTLILTASGVFLELEDALNEIWGVKHEGGMLSGLVRARLMSLGLVAGLGFLLLVSLGSGRRVERVARSRGRPLAVGASLFVALNFLVTLILVAVLFAAIYKLLPAKPLAWPYVFFGAGVTALLFQVGKLLIGLYLGKYGVGSSSRGGRCGSGPAAVDLLLGADFSLRRGDHQGSL